MRCRAMILVDHNDLDARNGVVLTTEDHGKDTKEGERQHETQGERRAVPAERCHSGANDGEDQSRSSLPVRCRKTDSRLGRRRETSASSRPSLAASSRSPAISMELAMVNKAAESTILPPRRSTQAAISGEV